MTQLSRLGMSRHCTGCNEERLFEQFHAEPASCPDVPDGDCPEWACAVCGDALIIGLPAPAYVRSDSIPKPPGPPDPSKSRRNSANPGGPLCFLGTSGTASNPAIRVKHGVRA